MTANTNPIYSIAGDVSSNNSTGMAALVTASDNTYTGVSGTIVWTADATNGGYIQRLRFKAGGTNNASVARIYINNGAALGTGTNNSFYGEISLPATTAITTAATVDIDYAMNFALPAGWRISVSYPAAGAAGWACVGVGGEY